LLDPGSWILYIGSRWYLPSSYRRLDQEEERHERSIPADAVRFLTRVSVYATLALCLTATAGSMATGRLSSSTGLDWEVYLALFAVNGAWLLLQAVVRVYVTEVGFVFGATAFLQASLPSFLPSVSDFFDTLKDCLFGAFCFQSEQAVLKGLGLLSWAWVVLVHVKLLHQEGTGFLELSATYISVFLARSKHAGANPKPMCEQIQTAGRAAGVALFKQTSPSKLQMVLWENLPQAVFAVVYTIMEGAKGSKIPALLNVGVPLAQLLAGVLLNPLLRQCAAGPLFQEFLLAMQSQDGARKKYWTEEVGPSLWEGMQHSKAGSQVKKLDLWRNKIGDRGAKALAAALPKSFVEELNLRHNDIGDEGAEALAAGLPGSQVKKLDLYQNKIGDRGAKALAATIPKSSVEELSLGENDIVIGGEGAEALRHAERQKPGLWIRW